MVQDTYSDRPRMVHGEGAILFLIPFLWLGTGGRQQLVLGRRGTDTAQAGPVGEMGKN